MQRPTVDVRIVLSTPDHADALEALQASVYYISKIHDAPDVLKAHHFRAQCQVFPDAQWVAIDTATGRIVGHTSGLLIHYDPTQPFLESWVQTTGHGLFTTHQPDGDWMYGAETAVLPDYQGQGVGSRLYNARFKVCRRLNLRGMVAGSTIMNYCEVADRMSPERYMTEVVAGRLYDNNLTKQLRKGFRALNIIPNYVSDTLSLGYGVAIVWHNPDYQPPAIRA